ncbi:MAG: hypothetical protein AAGD01_18295 [Acidobacteriota bacterium]
MAQIQFNAASNVFTNLNPTFPSRVLAKTALALSLFIIPGCSPAPDDLTQGTKQYPDKTSNSNELKVLPDGSTILLDIKNETPPIYQDTTSYPTVSNRAYFKMNPEGTCFLYIRFHPEHQPQTAFNEQAFDMAAGSTIEYHFVQWKHGISPQMISTGKGDAYRMDTTAYTCTQEPFSEIRKHTIKSKSRAFPVDLSSEIFLESYGIGIFIAAYHSPLNSSTRTADPLNHLFDYY